MRTLALVLGSAALALAISPASAKSVSERGEAQLALMLGSRTAGAPVECISTASARPDALEVIDGLGVVFKAGGTIWVSRAADPAKLRSTDVERVEQLRPSQLCSTDRIWTYDKFDGSPTGMVALTDFVPYTREG
jgi:hypothetical protein